MADSFPDQSILHDEGKIGNCLQATIAAVLGWPLKSVPHFALLGEVHWWDSAQAWLDAQGYWIDYKADTYVREGGTLMPRCWLSGKSPRGFSHAVVGNSANGQMLHDPHPSRAGLVAVDYTVYFFRKPREVDAGRALHTGAIATLSRLMDGDPAPGTPQGDGLSLLADAIANYERATHGVSVAPPGWSEPSPTDGRNK